MGERGRLVGGKLIQHQLLHLRLDHLVDHLVDHLGTSSMMNSGSVLQPSDKRQRCQDI